MAHDAIMEEQREHLAGLGKPADTTPHPSAPLRSPDITNRTDRLGAMHGTRLSFVRSLVRRMAHDNWRVRVTRMDLDDNGYGVCIYTIEAYGERRAGQETLVVIEVVRIGILVERHGAAAEKGARFRRSLSL